MSVFIKKKLHFNFRVGKLYYFVQSNYEVVVKARYKSLLLQLLEAFL